MFRIILYLISSVLKLPRGKANSERRLREKEARRVRRQAPYAVRSIQQSGPEKNIVITVHNQEEEHRVVKFEIQSKTEQPEKSVSPEPVSPATTDQPVEEEDEYILEVLEVEFHI